MAMVKQIFTAHQTVIGAAFLNALQDEVLDNRVAVDAQTLTAAQKTQVRTNIGAVSESDVATATKIVEVTTPAFSSLPQTFSDSQLTFGGSVNHITTDLVCPPNNFILSTPSAMGGDWTINTDTAGQITISGTFAGSTGTTLKLFLEHR